MDEKLSLDFFRYNDLSFYSCQISYDIGSVILPFVYNDYFNKTTLDFITKLKFLENIPFCPVSYDADILQIYTSYFACFEQFVSTLYEILYFYKITNTIPNEKESIKIFRRDYRITIAEIVKIISTTIEYNKTGLVNKISELEDARNYILHGNIGRIKVRKTKLPSYPLQINYEGCYGRNGYNY